MSQDNADDLRDPKTGKMPKNKKKKEPMKKRYGGSVKKMARGGKVKKMARGGMVKGPYS